MVRKRSRGAKRYFDSEDEPETESDFEDDDPVYKPQAKKYSLRQRKKPTFNSDDYEYEEDMFDVPPRKEPSDDEEFEVKNTEQTNLTENQTECTEKNEDISESVDTAKPPEEEAATEQEQEQEELVDFEDMIRADIVMNKNRIDYDNVIQKTEIKIQPLPASERAAVVERKRQKPPPVVKPKGKRGRKPKRRNSDIELDEPQFLAPQIQENENDEDYHPYKPKRTRKPKTRPAGEVDSSILDDFDDYEFEDQNDVDYNPDDDLDYPGLSGLSNYILDKQISAEFENENNVEHLQNSLQEPVHSVNIEEPVNSMHLEEPVNSIKEVDNPETLVDSSSTTIMDSTVAVTAIEESSQDAEAVSVSQTEEPSESDTTSRVPVEDTDSIVPVPDKSTVPIEDTPSVDPLQDTSESAQTESSPNNEDTNNVDDDDSEDDGVPRVLNEISGAFEKVTSTTYASVIRVNETIVNSDLQVNGNAKHIENPEVNIMDCKEEVESEDDDIVFIEDERKCEVIVLDD